MARRPGGSGLVGKLLSFLSAKEAELTPATSERPTEPSPARDSSVGPAAPVAENPLQDYESRLAAMVSEQGSAVSGRMQLVNLSKIAKHFGARWPKVEEKVHSIIKGILDNRLSSADYYVRQGDDNYYFLFAGLSESEASIKCSMLTREITTKLIGEEAEMADVDLRPVVVRVDGLMPPAATPFAAVDQRLNQKQAEVGRVGPDASAPTILGGRNGLTKAQCRDLITPLETIGYELKQRQQNQPEARHSSVVRLEGVAQLLRQAEHAIANLVAANPAPDQNDATGAPASPMTAKPLLMDDWENTSRPDRSTLEWQFFNVLPKLIELTLVKVETELKLRAELLILDALQAAPPVAPVEKAVSEDLPPFLWNGAEVMFSYLPMWQVRKNVINSYLCQIALKSGDGIHSIEALFDEEIDEIVIASLDRLVLRKALQDIDLLIQSDQQSNIVVPVHFATLVSSRAWREYLGVLALVRPELRPYLIWELIYPHIGVYNGQIQQAASLLKPYGRAVLLRVSLDYPRFDDLAAAGIYAVGADISCYAQNEAEVIRKMEVFQTKVELGGFKLYLHGVNSLSLATAAICAGCDHIDGDTVSWPIDNPEGIRSYRIESLYAHLFAPSEPSQSSA